MRIDKNMTNKEEAQWLMQWWKNYGQGILIAVMIGLVFGFGWRYWNAQNQKKSFKAFDMYQQIQPDMNVNTASIEAAKNALRKNYPNSIYMQLTVLDDVNQLATQGLYAKAIDSLQPIIAKPKIAALGSLASIETAQLYNQLNQPQKSLDSLNAVSDPSFEGLVDNEKALAYSLLNEPVQAGIYLNKAIDIFNQLHIDTSLLMLNAGFK